MQRDYSFHGLLLLGERWESFKKNEDKMFIHREVYSGNQKKMEHLNHFCRCFLPILKENKSHPRKLTWNLKMMVWQMFFLLQGCILRFHVNLPGCRFQRSTKKSSSAAFCAKRKNPSASKHLVRRYIFTPKIYPNDLLSRYLDFPTV